MPGSVAKTVVVVCERKYLRGAASEMHAISISGYHLVSDDCDYKMISQRIDKLYVHDDQIGPYARAVVKADKWECSWHDSSGNVDAVQFNPLWLLMPIYHKIRVEYESIWQKACEIDYAVPIFEKFLGPIKLEWGIHLDSANQLKQHVRNDDRIPNDEKQRLLLMPMPKYIWCVKVSINKHESAFFMLMPRMLVRVLM